MMRKVYMVVNCIIKKVLNDSEYRIVTINILLSILLKAGSLAISLINTRLYIVFFQNNTVLGGWYAIMSILNWILYLDLGIGNGVRNRIVVPLENKEYHIVKKYVSTGYIVIGVISGIIIVIGTIISMQVNWNSALNIPEKDVSYDTLLIMVIISIIGVGIQFWLKTIISIYQALRKTAVTGICAMITNIIMVIFLILYPKAVNENDYILFACVYTLSTVSPFLLLSIFGYVKDLKQIRPSLRYYSNTAVKEITKLGLAFFIIQVALLILSSTDAWLIAFFFEPADGVEYQIYFRVFSIALTIFALFSQTIWSSITKYAGEGNIGRINKLYGFLNVIATLGGCGCMIVALLFKHIASIWIGDVYNNIDVLHAMLFAFWMLIQMIVNASTAVANGLGKLKCQSIFVPVAGIIKVIGVVVASALGYDWTSVLVFSIVGLIPLVIAQHIAIRRELLKLSNRKEAQV